MHARLTSSSSGSRPGPSIRKPREPCGSGCSSTKISCSSSSDTTGYPGTTTTLNREDTVGVMKEAGLSDYLVLLSIYQTCRFKGLSFLKFLLSKERDIDAFCARKRTRRRHQDIELYPKGYTPAHLAALHKPKATEQSREFVANDGTRS